MAVEKHIPMRKCVGCGEFIGKKGAVRIVRDKEGGIFVDYTGKKSGRGAYLCKDMSCFDAALKGRKLERSLKCQIPSEIYETVKKELTADE